MTSTPLSAAFTPGAPSLRRLLDAARIDGSGVLGRYWHVVQPGATRVPPNPVRPLPECRSRKVRTDARHGSFGVGKCNVLHQPSPRAWNVT